MSPAKRGTGTVADFGETAAREYLIQHGYRIVGQNVQIGHEELDLICETRETRAFVEVKTRTMRPDGPHPWGTPSDAVTKSKRRHLLSCARQYNLTHPTKKQTRMDIVEVYLEPRADGALAVLKIHHMENAFGA